MGSSRWRKAWLDTKYSNGVVRFHMKLTGGIAGHIHYGDNSGHYELSYELGSADALVALFRGTTTKNGAATSPAKELEIFGNIAEAITQIHGARTTIVS